MNCPFPVFRLLLVLCAAAPLLAFAPHGNLSLKPSCPVATTTLFATSGKRLTPAQRAIQKQKQSKSPSSFDQVKTAFYANVDGIKSIAPKKITAEAPESTIIGGYSDIEITIPPKKAKRKLTRNWRGRNFVMMAWEGEMKEGESQDLICIWESDQHLQ